MLLADTLREPQMVKAIISYLLVCQISRLFLHIRSALQAQKKVQVKSQESASQKEVQVSRWGGKGGNN